VLDQVFEEEDEEEEEASSDQNSSLIKREMGETRVLAGIVDDDDALAVLDAACRALA